MELISCPVCGTKNAAYRFACLKCGVELFDPTGADQMPEEVPGEPIAAERKLVMDKSKKLDEILAEVREQMDAEWEREEKKNERTLRYWLFTWCPLIGAAAGYFSASVTAGVLIWGFLSFLYLLIEIRRFAGHIKTHLFWLTSYLKERAAHHLD